MGDIQISVLEDEADEVKSEIKRGEVCDFIGPLVAPSFQSAAGEDQIPEHFGSELEMNPSNATGGKILVNIEDFLIVFERLVSI